LGEELGRSSVTNGERRASLIDTPVRARKGRTSGGRRCLNDL